MSRYEGGVEGQSARETQAAAHSPVRRSVPEPPRGWATLRWLGPGLLWMISAVGSGSVLFTPRIGARYQYELLWLGLLVCFLMWVMIREAGRYTVVTGETLLEGFHRLPGPRNWAVWFVFVPQLIAAVAGIAGLAALVGSVFKEALSGNHVIYAVAMVVVAATLVAAGKYKKVENAAQWLAGILIGITVIAAIQVMPPLSTLASGLMPKVPGDADIYFIVPWVGTILAGSMGIIWYSYWAATRGYGGGVEGMGEDGDEQTGAAPRRTPEQKPQAPLEPQQRQARLKRWLRVMDMTALLGVIAGTLVIVAFMVLGSELLAPKGLIPEGVQVAKDLSKLLEEVWGRVGYWLLLLAIFIALGGSIFANQDGWGRSFADMNLIMLRRHRGARHEEPQANRPPLTRFERFNQRFPLNLAHRRTLKNLYVLILTGVLPILVIIWVKDPVTIMSASGIIAAVHTPVIVAMILAVNHRLLPTGLRPGWFVCGVLLFSTLFYAGFGVLQLWSTLGGS